MSGAGNQEGEQVAASGFVVWFQCVQSGGCPDLCSASVMTSTDDVIRSIEGDLDDEMTACLLVDCRPEFEVRVIQAGELVSTIDLYPFLSATLDGVRHDMDPEGVEALLEADGGEYLDLAVPTWKTTLDGSGLRAQLPELVAPVARSGEPLCFEDAGESRELPWGTSTPSF